MVEKVEDVCETGNTKQSRISASKYWCFTYNNYEVDSLSKMVTKFKSLNIEYMIGKEIGESGTPHLQGYIECPKVARWTEFGFPKEIHWEKRKGNKLQNLKYCSKDGDFVTSFFFAEIKLPKLRGWQLIVKDWSESEPDDRTIYWIWSSSGKRGKSTMCKFLAMQGAIITGGKATDMKFQISRYEQENGYGPKNIIFDVPRSNFQYLSYGGIEEIKNGVFSSPKYESCMCIINNPNVFVFCNFPPDLDNKDMSSDRFKVLNVDEELIEYENDSCQGCPNLTACAAI